MITTFLEKVNPPYPEYASCLESLAHRPQREANAAFYPSSAKKLIQDRSVDERSER